MHPKEVTQESCNVENAIKAANVGELIRGPCHSPEIFHQKEEQFYSSEKYIIGYKELQKEWKKPTAEYVFSRTSSASSPTQVWPEKQSLIHVDLQSKRPHCSSLRPFGASSGYLSSSDDSSASTSSYPLPSSLLNSPQSSRWKPTSTQSSPQPLTFSPQSTQWDPTSSQISPISLSSPQPRRRKNCSGQSAPTCSASSPQWDLTSSQSTPASSTSSPQPTRWKLFSCFSPSDSSEKLNDGHIERRLTKYEEPRCLGKLSPVSLKKLFSSGKSSPNHECQLSEVRDELETYRQLSHSKSLAAELLKHQLLEVLYERVVSEVLRRRDRLSLEAELTQLEWQLEVLTAAAESSQRVWKTRFTSMLSRQRSDQSFKDNGLVLGLSDMDGSKDNAVKKRRCSV